MADQGLQLRHGLHHLGGQDHQHHAGGVVCQARNVEYIMNIRLCIIDVCSGYLACLPIDYTPALLLLFGKLEESKTQTIVTGY